MEHTFEDTQYFSWSAALKHYSHGHQDEDHGFNLLQIQDTIFQESRIQNLKIQDTIFHEFWDLELERDKLVPHMFPTFNHTCTIQQPNLIWKRIVSIKGISTQLVPSNNPLFTFYLPSSITEYIQNAQFCSNFSKHNSTRGKSLNTSSNLHGLLEILEP